VEHNGFDAPDRPAPRDPGAETVAAIAGKLVQTLGDASRRSIEQVLTKATGDPLSSAIEGSELLLQFEADTERAVAQAFTASVIDEAIVEAVADLVYPPEPQLQFETLDAFVTGYIARVYRRDVLHGREYLWCPRWFEHEPAVVTLTGLWLSFEVLRNDPGTGPAVWQRDYLLPLMNALTSPSGPLVGCKATQHSNPLPPLPCEPTPPGLFEDTPAEVTDAVRTRTTPPPAQPPAESGRTPQPAASPSR
jgi:hypothetical protein